MGTDGESRVLNHEIHRGQTGIYSRKKAQKKTGEFKPRNMRNTRKKAGFKQEVADGYGFGGYRRVAQGIGLID
jgi:hypothetical protein